MNPKPLLATLAVLCFVSNVGNAQESFTSSFGNLKEASFSNITSPSNLSSDISDLRLTQQSGAESATLFNTETESEKLTFTGHQSAAQQAVVRSTLPLIGGGLLIGLLAIGAFIYSTQRKNGLFGDVWSREGSDW